MLHTIGLLVVGHDARAECGGGPEPEPCPAPACTSCDVTVDADERRVESGGLESVSVTFTNTSASSCKLVFDVTELYSPDSLVLSVTPADIVLAPGDAVVVDTTISHDASGSASWNNILRVAGAAHPSCRQDLTLCVVPTGEAVVEQTWGHSLGKRSVFHYGGNLQPGSTTFAMGRNVRERPGTGSASDGCHQNVMEHGVVPPFSPASLSDDPDVGGPSTWTVKADLHRWGGPKWDGVGFYEAAVTYYAQQEAILGHLDADGDGLIDPILPCSYVTPQEMQIECPDGFAPYADELLNAAIAPGPILDPCPDPAFAKCMKAQVMAQRHDIAHRHQRPVFVNVP